MERKMTEENKNPPTLAEKLFDLHSRMDDLKEEMVKEGWPVVAIAWADKVTLPAFEMLIRAQHTKVAIAEVDEALVSSLSAIIYDYLQRTHPRNDTEEAKFHFELIGQDISDRVVSTISKEFAPTPSLILPRKMN